jgi:hypothetical protein
MLLHLLTQRNNRQQSQHLKFKTRSIKPMYLPLVMKTKTEEKRNDHRLLATFCVIKFDLKVKYFIYE